MNIMWFTSSFRRLSAIAVLFLALPSCAKLTIAWADLSPDGAAASPPILGAFEEDGPVATLDDWRTRRAPALKDALQRVEFGYFPDASSATAIEKRVLDEHAYGGGVRLEEWVISATATFDGRPEETRDVMESGGFLLHVLIPADARGPTPVIMMETFCPWWDAVPHEKVVRPEGAGEMTQGFVGGLMHYVFGRYICTPPYAEIARRGYAVATLYPGSAIPDSPGAGLAQLRRLSSGYEDDETRWGAVAGWAWLYSRMVDLLEADGRFDANAMIAWGHSRYGKAALAAAAYDDRIDGVISHQSGTGGASLTPGKPGETLEDMVEQYPHWFSRTYASYATHAEDLPIDQHQLLALIAPRPILLGNARRDVWSDPNGAFRAALGADPVWELYGSEGLVQTRLNQWRPTDDIAFWMRPGTHGVVKEDWPAFLEFLDAHFKSEPAPS